MLSAFREVREGLVRFLVTGLQNPDHWEFSEQIHESFIPGFAAETVSGMQETRILLGLNFCYSVFISNLLL